jgi:hypothetical protein
LAAQRVRLQASVAWRASSALITPLPSTSRRS